MSDPNGTVNNSRDPGAFFNVRFYSSSSLSIRVRLFTDDFCGTTFCVQQQGGAPSGSAAAIPNFKLPAETAIAGVLTRSWAKDDVVGWGVQGGKL